MKIFNSTILLLSLFSSSIVLAVGIEPLTVDEHAPNFRISWELNDMKEENLIVVRNNQLIFEALGEESTELGVQRVSILRQPEKGEVRLDVDFAMIYTPHQDICEEVDGFTYIIERGDQTDTISVAVEILCETLTIFSGFSPNGDGVNDTFVVKGIENFPDNSLAIFDYAGQEIFYQKNYQNDWDGSNTAEPLSTEYTYYYVFHDGEGNYHSGYLKMDF